MFDRADTVEVFRYRDGVIDRWVRLRDREAWSTNRDPVTFGQTFWSFSTAPTDSVVIQMIREKKRFGVIEVRDDGCLHLRKAARWYKMPVNDSFITWAKKTLESKGIDLPADKKVPSNPLESADNQFRY